jgi:hypothetical protein
MKCVRSNVWMAAAALVINFPLYLQIEDLASALGFGKGMKATCVFSSLLKSEAFYLVFRSLCKRDQD